jgi:AraC family transcriptional regulator of arabinose operon
MLERSRVCGKRFGGDPAVSPTIDDRIARALGAMEQRMAEALTVRELAAVAGLSPSRFAHLFRRTVGVPPLRHLHALRMRRARRLLEDSTLSIRDVMRQVGWNDPSHFSKDFKRRFGVSPRLYRDRIRSLVAVAL